MYWYLSGIKLKYMAMFCGNLPVCIPIYVCYHRILASVGVVGTLLLNLIGLPIFNKTLLSMMAQCFHFYKFKFHQELHTEYWLKK